MADFRKHIEEYMGITDEGYDYIHSFFKTRHLKKGDHFLREGRMADQLAYVQDGIMREYVFINEKEVTKAIACCGNFTNDLCSFMFKKPARWNIEAVIDTELKVISRSDYERIGKILPEWHELEKQFMAKCFASLEDNLLRHISMTAEERYQHFFSGNMELFNYVPLQYIASMLGMAPETLSRIRRRPAMQIS